MKIHPSTATEYAWIELDTEDEAEIAAIARVLQGLEGVIRPDGSAQGSVVLTAEEARTVSRAIECADLYWGAKLVGKLSNRWLEATDKLRDKLPELY